MFTESASAQELVTAARNLRLFIAEKIDDSSNNHNNEDMDILLDAYKQAHILVQKLSVLDGSKHQ